MSQLESTSPQTPFFEPTMLFTDAKDALADSPIIAVLDPAELAFELGAWLSGLSSFTKSGPKAFDKNPEEATQRDWAKECRLTYAALLRCSKLNFHLRKLIVAQDEELGSTTRDLTVADLDVFTLVLRDAIVLNESVLRGAPLGYSDWRSWAGALRDRLASSRTAQMLIDRSRTSGENFLPVRLRDMIASESMSFSDAVDLRTFLPQFGTVLGYLNVVANMLQRDEPLKPSLIIFSRIFEQTNDLVSHMNNRLSRFTSEGAAMFDSLDSASYTATLELKKVYSQELAGLVGIRPVPSVFSRVETACELLRDSFSQIVAGFAHVIDPQITLSDLFPVFDSKLEQSLGLRHHLWELMKAVQSAEQNPDKALLDTMTRELQEFLDRTAGYLFHKDKETFERFAEEVFATSGTSDIVQILHRFGAYLETLLGQVNMRTVLADHPFRP